MDQRLAVLTGSLIALLLVSSAVISNTDSQNNEDQNFESTNYSADINTTADGVKYTVNPDELAQGCPGMDCIPSIDNPKYENGANADWMEPDDKIIGLEINGEAIAYPLRILSRHEIVNTEVGGEPVVVTYCPLCRSGVTYSRNVSGEILEFGVSGKLHNANLVMYDRQSETYWNQISGKAIVGEKVPQKLDLISSSITNWGKWKEGHPDTQVLSRDTGIYPVGTYASRSYQGYRNSGGVGFGVDQVDDRLPSKELVYGITIGNNSKAYPSDMINSSNLIQDEIGNETVLVFERPDDGTVTALTYEGEEKEFTLSSKGVEDTEGGRWTFEGEHLNGNINMSQNVPQGFYWFAWSKFNPDTQIYSQG